MSKVPSSVLLRLKVLLKVWATFLSTAPLLTQWILPGKITDSSWRAFCLNRQQGANSLGRGEDCLPRFAAQSIRITRSPSPGNHPETFPSVLRLSMLIFIWLLLGNPPGRIISQVYILLCCCLPILLNLSAVFLPSYTSEFNSIWSDKLHSLFYGYF